MIVSDERLQDKIRQMRWFSLSVGLALAVGFSILYNQIANPDEMSLSLVLAGMMRYFGGWICILAFFGLGMQYLTMRTPRLDYANEAVLPFYILHQTVILVVGFFVLKWAIPDVLEWVVVVMISFAVIMAIYEYLIRRWNVMRFLFGMKRLLPRPAAGVQKAATWRHCPTWINGIANQGAKHEIRWNMPDHARCPCPGGFLHPGAGRQSRGG